MKKWDSDIVTSIILRIGVVLSVAFILTGLGLLLVRNGSDGYTLQQISDFTSNQVTSSSLLPGNIFYGILRLDGLYFISMGLWTLIFTPVTVVFVALFDFVREGNGRYVLMSAIVLTTLLFAIFIL